MHPGREGLLLQALTLEVNGYCLQFKLAPAYSLYMVARYNLSASYNRAVERHQSLVQLLRSTCSLIKKAVKVVCLCVLCILYVSVCVRVCARMQRTPLLVPSCLSQLLCVFVSCPTVAVPMASVFKIHNCSNNVLIQRNLTNICIYMYMYCSIMYTVHVHYTTVVEVWAVR